jgi:hypothetical protein
VGAKDVRTVHVRDSRTGTDLLTQAVDANDDGTFDELIFQADLAPGETRSFALAAGERRIAKKEEFRAYGRFVRERRDDFAWENDLVAHRMYGAALETWAQEPLTSSTIDVWVKRTRRLVINDWYMVDDYHRDTGEGADFYSAGKSRGCGGSGIWRNGRLYVSANFRGSRMLANGPIRVTFELEYDPWDAGGSLVSETKRISLDAGSHLNRMQSTYRQAPAGAAVGVGIKNSTASVAVASAGTGVLRTWEPITASGQSNGSLGCAVLLSPGATVEPVQADGNYLAVAPLEGNSLVYAAGSAWDRSGAMPDVAAWDAYLARESARLRAPVVVRIGAPRQ